MEFNIGEEVEILDFGWEKVKIFRIDKSNDPRIKYVLKVIKSDGYTREWAIPNPPLNWGDIRKLIKKRNHQPKWMQEIK